MTVIDTAQNGREAVDKALQLRPDVITMDIEMPVLDGISAVREIMAKCPTPILMFSSLTHEGQGDPGCTGCRRPRFSAQEVRRHRP